MEIPKAWIAILGVVGVAVLLFNGYRAFVNSEPLPWGCKNFRTNEAQWQPNASNSIKVCPGQDNRISFESEFVPIVDNRQGLRVLSSHLKCNEIFRREWEENDVVVCYSGHGRLSAESGPPGQRKSIHRYILRVMENEKTAALEDGAELDVFIHKTIYKPPPVVRGPSNPVKEHPCDGQYRRATNCVVAYFQVGQTYDRPPPRRTADGRQYCYFTAGSAQWLLEFKNSDGSRRYEKRQNTAPTASFFFELAPGEHAGNARCRE